MKFVVIFLAMNMSFSVPAASADGTPARVGRSGYGAVELFKELGAVEKIRIPEEMGTVESVYRGKSGKTVLLVQDAHSVPEAQKQIQRLIGYFQKYYGLRLVTLEGSASPLDSRIFRSYPDPARLAKRLESYASAGELAGANAAALLNPPGTDYEGIEDWGLYEKGLEAYQHAMKMAPEVLEKIRIQKGFLGREKSEKFQGALKEVDRISEDFLDGKIDLATFLKQSSRYAMPPRKTDLGTLIMELKRNEKFDLPGAGDLFRMAEKAKADLERRQRDSAVASDLKSLNESLQIARTVGGGTGALALILQGLSEKYAMPQLRTRKLDYLAMKQKRMGDIRGSRLAREIDRYLFVLGEHYARTKDEKALLHRGRLLHLLEKTSTLELGKKEWDELFEFLRKGPVMKHGQPPFAGVDGWSSLLRKMRSHFVFYRIADARDRVFVRKTLSQMRRKKTEAALLVAGGFHTENLLRQFQERGISCLWIAPRLSSIPEKIPYREQMQGRVSWSRYFNVQNGRVDLYGAFVRGLRDRLLAPEEGEKEEGFQGAVRDHGLLKRWRDQVLRDLAAESRIGQASRYTRFLDEIGRTPLASQEDLRRTWLRNIRRFGQQLEHWAAEDRLSVRNIERLLDPATSQPAVLVPGVRSEIRSELIDAELSGHESNPGNPLRDLLHERLRHTSDILTQVQLSTSYNTLIDPNVQQILERSGRAVFYVGEEETEEFRFLKLLLDGKKEVKKLSSGDLLSGKFPPRAILYYRWGSSGNEAERRRFLEALRRHLREQTALLCPGFQDAGDLREDTTFWPAGLSHATIPTASESVSLFESLPATAKKHAQLRKIYRWMAHRFIKKYVHEKETGVYIASGSDLSDFIGYVGTRRGYFFDRTPLRPGEFTKALELWDLMTPHVLAIAAARERRRGSEDHMRVLRKFRNLERGKMIPEAQERRYKALESVARYAADKKADGFARMVGGEEHLEHFLVYELKELGADRGSISLKYIHVPAKITRLTFSLKGKKYEIIWVPMDISKPGEYPPYFDRIILKENFAAIFQKAAFKLLQNEHYWTFLRRLLERLKDDGLLIGDHADFDGQYHSPEGVLSGLPGYQFRNLSDEHLMLRGLYWMLHGRGMGSYSIPEIFMKSPRAEVRGSTEGDLRYDAERIRSAVLRYEPEMIMRQMKGLLQHEIGNTRLTLPADRSFAIESELEALDRIRGRWEVLRNIFSVDSTVPFFVTAMGEIASLAVYPWSQMPVPKIGDPIERDRLGTILDFQFIAQGIHALVVRLKNMRSLIDEERRQKTWRGTFSETPNLQPPDGATERVSQGASPDIAWEKQVLEHIKQYYQEMDARIVRFWENYDKNALRVRRAESRLEFPPMRMEAIRRAELRIAATVAERLKPGRSLLAGASADLPLAVLDIVKRRGIPSFIAAVEDQIPDQKGDGTGAVSEAGRWKAVSGLEDALIAGLSAVDPRLSLGLYIPNNAGMDRASYLKRLEKVLSAHVGELVYSGEIGALRSFLRAQLIRERAIGKISEKVVPFYGHEHMVWLITEGLAPPDLYPDFVPVMRTSGVPGDPLIEGYLDLLCQVAAIHAADLILKDRKLASEPDRLKQELIGRLLIADERFSSAFGIQQGQNGILIDSIAMRLYLDQAIQQATAQAA
ncbi:MAG: hypothetical protein ACOY3K_02000 [Candidatus Omnitrophota bacterium]